MPPADNTDPDVSWPAADTSEFAANAGSHAAPAGGASSTDGDGGSRPDNFVFRFGNGLAEGNKSMKELLGGKGANLSEMSSIGLPVPPGYTITAEACRQFAESEGDWPSGMAEEVDEGTRHIEEAMDKELGNPKRPLLVSVRSGAAVSMPGMMDTVLNLGLNDEVVEGLARLTDNRRFAYDAYRRFIDMFGNVVRGIDRDHFEDAIEAMKQEKGVESDVDLDAGDLKKLVEQYKVIYEERVEETFPEDPQQQLQMAIDAVFASWNNPRAITYRRINHITGLLGTAVNVQAMVYGNMGDRSGTGVCFTRNPATGENELYGEFLRNAQGEDVVAGIRTPRAIGELKDLMPEIYDELVEVRQRLEAHYQNMEDLEFTVEEGSLYLLQTRDGKRTGTAAVKIAVDMVDEGLIDEATAVRDLVEPNHLNQLLHPQFKDAAEYTERVICEGLPASPGAAVGHAVFSVEEAEEARDDGRDVILVRTETSPEDVGGMDAAEGIVTSRGGMTSHAAVVARGWGKPCVAGCGAMVIDEEAGSFEANGTTVESGDWIAINGSTGEVIVGRPELTEPKMGGNFARFMEWADAHRRMGVRTNADTAEDAEKALEFGAEGIGLCRTEHMFFEGERLARMRRMVLSDTEEDRREALEGLLPDQRKDFISIFEAMEGRPVTIRLLDPPLHEFLPLDRRGQQEMAERQDIPVEDVRRRVDFLREVNPMLGHRGCRLGIVYPEITEMQARAILEAAVALAQDGKKVRPEIMVPLIGTVEEFRDQRDHIDRVARQVFEEKNTQVDYLVGTMIEVPRAALVAKHIAAEADFFSFGTNDMTQMTFGYSRDDAGKFLPAYLEEKILADDPFHVLDQEGVGRLVKMATEQGREGKAGLKVGICGEHGGEPSSVAFCHDIGLDYVSCSPYRVPIARLAAAQAALGR